MARVRIEAGAEFDLLNKGELDQGLKTAADAWFQERAHGVKYMRIPVMAGSVAGGAVQLGSVGLGVGPSQGFAWAIQRLTVRGLAASDTLTVFRNTTDDQNAIGVIGAGTASTFHVGSKGFLLMPGETIILAGSSLTATGMIIVNGEAIEVPATMVWKIL